MNRRTVNAWCLYDFGNSAFAVLFPAMFGPYFVATVVGEENGEAYWGYVGSLAMLLVALSAPVMGGIADHAGVRKRMLGIYTVLAVGCVLGFTQVGAETVALGICLAVLANFAFEGGIVFYNAYLPEIAPASHHGRVSARGFAVGYAGSLIALAIAAPLAFHGLMAWVWCALALQWSLAAIPALRVLPKDEPTALGVWEAARRGIRETRATLRDVLGMKDLRRFLLAYFFYMDGVNTIIFFSGVYSQESLGFENTELLAMFGLVQVAALGGSVAMARPTDARGPRWAVRVLLLWWIGVVVAAYFATTKTVFWGVAVLAGLGLGGIQASSRAFMSRLIPNGREAEFFGFYALCGKTGAILGPALFGVVTQVASQRAAVLTVVPFYVAGYVLLRRVRVDD